MDWWLRINWLRVYGKGRLWSGWGDGLGSLWDDRLFREIGIGGESIDFNGLTGSPGLGSGRSRLNFGWGAYSEKLGMTFGNLADVGMNVAIFRGCTIIVFPGCFVVSLASGDVTKIDKGH